MISEIYTFLISIGKKRITRQFVCEAQNLKDLDGLKLNLIDELNLLYPDAIISEKS